MIKIFGLLFFIILICLIYLHYQGKISSNIPIIFMFFLILIIPFTYLENKNNIESFSSYDQIMNSSLDIYYTNQKSEKRLINELKKVKLIDNPIQTVLVQKDVKPITLSIFTKYYSPYIVISITSETINENLYTNFSNQIILTYITKANLFDQEFNSIKTRIKDYNDLNTLNTAISAVEADTYIIIVGNNIAPFKNANQSIRNTFINTFRFPDKINNLTSSSGSFIVILSKSRSSYTLINQKFTNDNNYLGITQNLIADSAYFTASGEQFRVEATRSSFSNISTDELIISKINVISPLNSNYSLSFTAENNESFVYLSSRQLNDQVVLYDNSEKSSTYLDTQKPQFWSFEPVTPIVTSPLIVFIRTYSRPYFYLDAELENGTMVLKASRFKAALRQHWEIIKDVSNYKIRHLKSGMYLGYSDFDGYLYKDTGSVFLSKSSNYLWNIKKILENSINRNVIESFENRSNLLQTTESPTDFGSEKNVSRTIWEPEYSSIWNGRWIYKGTIESYNATIPLKDVIFLNINMNNDGSGEVEDKYYKYKMNVINAGSNILTGIIPSGEYNGYRATFRMIPSDLEYTDPSKPFPIKMRYFIQKENKILNLSSGNIENLNGYSTKFEGKDKLILSNFLEASGIQTDPNLAYSENTLNNLNNSLKKLYSFTSHTFTNAGAQARNGPTLSAVRRAYSAASWAQDTTNNYLNMNNNNGIQLWMVPETAYYRIRAAGAKGSSTDDIGGPGAIVEIKITLIKGEIIKILVGQSGVRNGWAGGGGGGSFVIRSEKTPLIIAGGGGGTDYNNSGSGRKEISGTITTTGENGGNGGRGGQNGNGGNIGSGDGGGGGFLTNGVGNKGGASFVNGGAGGIGSGIDWMGTIAGQGGFGGGGGVSGYGAGGAGGGGYSGGGGGGAWSGGGGGGSYGIIEFTDSGKKNKGDGSVIITKIGPSSEKLKDIKQKKIMYGPWVSPEQLANSTVLNDGKIIYFIYENPYTKMVSSDGQEKYYNGTIDQFNPDNWNSYNNTGGGKYLLKDI